MSWFFEGTGAQLGFSISPTGKLHASGSGTQHCRPQGGDPEIFQFVSRTGGHWSLHTTENDEADYDGAGRGLKTFFAANDGRAAGMIQYFDPYEKEAASIGASILMPVDPAARVFSLFKAILGKPNCRYVISLNFFGLSMEDVPTNDIPKVAEFTHIDFLKRRAYFSDTVTVSVTGLVKPD